MSRIVIALGGNALGNTPSEQKELLKITAQKVAWLRKQGHEVIVGHGNGPQVGTIYNAFSVANTQDSKFPKMPLPECGGMSQGYIGYHMLSAIKSAFNKEGINTDVSYFLTQTFVDKNDPAFENPTKPIGPFYKTEAEALAENPGSTVKEDAGRGYRKVVASPLPINFLGIDTMKKALENKSTIIVGGGGGIPTIQNEDGTIDGVDGVIDKDFALEKMAELVNADMFIILTAVPKIYVNYNKPDQKALDVVSISELEKYIDENQFAPGSMLPKVKAVMKFAQSGTNKAAYIGELDKLEEVIQEKTGTKIVL